MEKLSGAPRLSDDQLLRLCEKYGLQAKLWRMKFCGLLPEVCKRRLYEKKRFRSIFEFALILGGLSEHQVRLVLNLDKRFEEMPHLHELLVAGKVSVNKLARVVSVVTTSNEEFWANQCKNLSNRALEVLVNDEKKLSLNSENSSLKIDYENFELGFESRGRSSLFQNFNVPTQNIFVKNNFETAYSSDFQNGLHNRQNDDKSLHVQTFDLQNNSINNANLKNINDDNSSVREIFGSKKSPEIATNFVSDSVTDSEPYNVDIQMKFMALVPKLDQKIKAKILELSEKGIDVNSVLAEILVSRESVIVQKKNEIVEGQTSEVKKSVSDISIDEVKSKTASRYIPVKTREVLRLEHGTKCSIPTCGRLAADIHHSQRFGLVKNFAPRAVHDPRYLAPMCKEHHQIAHSVDVKFGEVRKKIVMRE